MKKILLFVGACFAGATVSASNVEKIQFANKGNFSLGLMVGIPPYSGNAVMPTVSIDGMWGLVDGLAKTKTFGENGAIDLGFYANLCFYDYGTNDDNDAGWSIPVAIRSGFHWEFVKKLDVYAGFQGGIAISEGWDGLDDDSDIYADGIFGMYVGAKWMFTNAFGVRIEYSGDWIGGENNMPPFAGGVTFNF